MNSLNHYAYGAVGEWLFRRVAGIDCDPERPGFRRVLCRPLPHKALGWVKAWHQAHVGRIDAEWKVEEEQVRYRLMLPANVEARVVLPVAAMDSVILDGAPVDAHREIGAARLDKGQVTVDVGSGLWEFTWPRGQ
jgi:alpha-L-rhamnosidase